MRAYEPSSGARRRAGSARSSRRSTRSPARDGRPSTPGEGDRVEIPDRGRPRADPRLHRAKWIKGSKESRSCAKSALRPVLAPDRGRSRRRRSRLNHMKRGDELPTGVLEMVKVYVATKRDPLRRRQDGRPPRQQGCDRQDRARRGHALPRGRHAGRHHAQPAGRAVADERGADPRDPPGLGRARLQGDAVFDCRCSTARGRGRDRERCSARPAADTSTARSSSTTAAPASASTRRHRRLHVHAQAAPPRRRQDPRPRDRPLLADHPAAARRQGPLRRPALRRDGGLGRSRPTAPRTSSRNS